MAKKTYKMNSNCGPHRCKDGSTIRPGETIETSEELAKKFPSKFVCISEQQETNPIDEEEVEARREAERQAADPKTTSNDSSEEEEDRGKDVTGDFEEAVGMNVTIFKKNRKYVVYDEEGDALTEPSNKAMTREFLEGDDSEDEVEENEE